VDFEPMMPSEDQTLDSQPVVRVVRDTDPEQLMIFGEGTAKTTLPGVPPETTDPGDDDPRMEDATIDEGILESPPIPAHMLKELGPVVHHRDAEVTVLDLAAQIGLQPEKSVLKVEGA